MPNFAAVLKDEIVRLARKELKKELEGLRKASSSYRSEIAALKRRILALEKRVSRPIGRTTTRVAPDQNADETSPLRFSAKGLVNMRKKLGLSAAGLGMLLGVSAQTIYHWEAGKTRPRPQQVAAIAALRKMGKRQVAAHLAELAG